MHSRDKFPTSTVRHFLDELQNAFACIVAQNCEGMDTLSMGGDVTTVVEGSRGTDVGPNIKGIDTESADSDAGLNTNSTVT